MTNVLLVGDLHIKRSNKNEVKPLLDRICDMAKYHDSVILLGDIYNDHGVITSDVQKVIFDFFAKLSESGARILNIEGNHDQDGDGENSSLYVHGNNRLVVQISGAPKICDYENGTRLVLVPFYRSNQAFLNALKDIPDDRRITALICHQEIDGVRYDNGMYAPNGVKLEDIKKILPDVQIISGHIHKAQRFDNVWYPGSPHWLTKSDANEDKGLWSIGIANGQIRRQDFTPSDDICPRYYQRNVIHNNLEGLPDIKPDDKIWIDYFGNNKDVVEFFKSKYKHCFVKTHTEQKTFNTTVSETKGVAKSVEDYIESFNTTLDKVALRKEVLGRIYG